MQLGYHGVLCSRYSCCFRVVSLLKNNTAEEQYALETHIGPHEKNYKVKGRKDYPAKVRDIQKQQDKNQEKNVLSWFS